MVEAETCNISANICVFINASSITFTQLLFNPYLEAFIETPKFTPSMPQLQYLFIFSDSSD